MADDNSKNAKTRGIIPYRFPKGVSGNPGGSAKGYRKKLSAAFLRALAADFAEHGADALIATREKDPAAYARIVASLLPKEVEVASHPLDDLPDEELKAMIDHIRAGLGFAAAVAESESEDTDTGGPH
jgi:hypothetical protein